MAARGQIRGDRRRNCGRPRKSTRRVWQSAICNLQSGANSGQARHHDIRNSPDDVAPAADAARAVRGARHIDRPRFDAMHHAPPTATSALRHAVMRHSIDDSLNCTTTIVSNPPFRRCQNLFLTASNGCASPLSRVKQRRQAMPGTVRHAISQVSAHGGQDERKAFQKRNRCGHGDDGESTKEEFKSTGETRMVCVYGCAGARLDASLSGTGNRTNVEISMVPCNPTTIIIEDPGRIHATMSLTDC
ncbi:hypothetical protein ANO11243_006010 [Dothideomycetidae sp. 11243]|nr:hypothetical protein ANO11243_006010 [fungal sp. No.11243]